jgi:hypothetical protein
MSTDTVSEFFQVSAPVVGLRTETLKDAHDFVRCWDKIDRLRREVGLEDDVLLSPLHFLTATGNTRRSCSVACWRGEALIGLMYATEHIIRGAKTGYVVGGDYVGRGLLLCKADYEAAVIAASIRHMAAHGIHSIHFRLVPRDASIPVLPGLRIRCLDGLVPGDRMLLAADFNEFLATLGGHTRRNVRNYMRKAERAGIRFVSSVTQPEYQAAVDRMNGKATFRLDAVRLERDERLLALHSGARRFGLRSAEGDFVAVLCGFTQSNRFHLLTQLNDVHLGTLSLSLVLRGHTVAHLIECGHTSLQFMGGASLSLGRFCIPQRYRSIFVDKTKGAAAAVKRLGCKAVELSNFVGRPVPETLRNICNGHLDDGQLTQRTALGYAPLVFPVAERVEDGRKD